MPIFVVIDGESKEKGKKKNSKQHDFLGNTRLDSIEGLFRRTDIIHGDKKLVKQIQKDKKAGFKEGRISIFSNR